MNVNLPNSQGTRWFLLTAILIIPCLISAQKNATPGNIQEPYHYNVIKLNPTPMFLWSKNNLTFSYERLLKPNRSITFSFGYLEFPRLGKDTIAGLLDITSRNKWGYNLAVEYRFYLSKRNARPAPDGIYIAPYLSHYGYHLRNDVHIINTSADSTGQLKGNFSVFNLGVELGYQIVFKKRFTLDLVFIGPSASFYTGKVSISGDMNTEQIKNSNEDIYNKLKEKYPRISDFVVNKSFKENGKVDLFAFGFRYLIQLGYHF
jgi:hypothetical protein